MNYQSFMVPFGLFHLCQRHVCSELHSGVVWLLCEATIYLVLTLCFALVLVESQLRCKVHACVFL